MIRTMSIVVLVCTLAVALGSTVCSQTITQPKGVFGATFAGTVTVDDSDSGFIASGSLANAPLADAVCGAQITEMTCSFAPDRIPLYLAKLDKAQVCLGIPYGTGLHYTAEYRPSSPFYECGSPGPAWDTSYHHVCQWVPGLSQLGTGCYEVWVYIPWGSTSTAPYTVADAYGAQAIAPFPQYGAGDKCSTPLNSWVRLDPTNAPAEPCDSANPKLWRFNGVNSGQYLQLDNQTGDPLDANHPTGLNYVVYDAAAFKLICGASIQVSTFCDVNNNGVYDSGVDQILTGRSVNLYASADCSGQPIGSGITDWTFNTNTLLQFGLTYSAREANGKCWPNAKVVLNSCSNHIYIPVKGSISVVKFNDTNSNGVRDTGEAGLSGWKIKLWHQNTDGSLTFVTSCTTDFNGQCQFTDLDNATYVISEGDTWQVIPTTNGSTTSCELRTTGPDGKVWKFTGAVRDNGDSPILPSDLCNKTQDPVIPISVAIAGCDERTVLIGNAPLGGSLTVFKFNDANLNMAHDTTEQMLPGYTIKLWLQNADGSLKYLASQITDSGGKCVFTDLDTANYVVSEMDGGKIVPTSNGCDVTTTGPDNRNWMFTCAIRDNGDPMITAADLCGNTQAPAIRALVAISGPVSRTLWIGNAPLASLSVCKFEDCNMNGSLDSGENKLPGWPVELTGTRANGVPINPLFALTDDRGCATFTNLAPGSYTISENGNGIVWDKVLTTCGAVSYCDFRTNWAGVRYQSTTIRPPDNGSGGNVPSTAPITITGADASISLGNVCLQTVSAFDFDDLNMDGVYNPQTEPVISNWPFALSGNRADGRPVCGAQSTGTDGYARFLDTPPSDATGYTLSEAQSVGGTVYLNGQALCSPSRFRSAGPVNLVLSCLTCGTTVPPTPFGNPGLTELDGVKEVVNADETSGDPSGWHIYLEGKDLKGNDVTPTDINDQPLPLAANPPTQSGKWYEVVTDKNGRFVFYDLPAGHYYLAEQASSYHCTMQPPLDRGFDLTSCPQTVTVINWKTGKLFQVDPATSNGTLTYQSGYQSSTQDVITALPAVLSINPGDNWQNFVAAAQAGVAYTIKDVSLTKTFNSFIQCADVFTPVNIVQHGSSGIRLWWPLMYEPPTTTWTLSLLYGTPSLVQLPGENAPAWVHTDVWTWVVDTDIPHMLLFLDTIHEIPFGKDEVPLISDENLLVTLKQILTSAKDAIAQGDTFNAGTLLSDFELEVMDACIGSSPAYPRPTGEGTGIANTDENPACCKLLVDTEYVGKATGAFVQNR